MDHCKHCGADLQHVPGRKKKAFCDVNCRNKWFYADRKRLIAESLKARQTVVADLPADFIKVDKIGILTKDGEVKPIELPKSDEKTGKIPEWKRQLQLRRQQKSK